MSDTNLILNGGFETGDFTDWTVSDPEPGNPDIGVDSNPDDVNSGSFGVFAGNSETSTLSQSVATVAGHTYAVSFYLDVYQADATEGSFSATFGGQAVVSLTEPSETDNNADPFTLYTVDIVATTVSSLLEFSFLDPPGFFGLDDVSVVDTVCFCRGTQILTARGEVAVEALRVGDLVVTLLGSGAVLKPVKWLGHRTVDPALHPCPQDVHPIRISAGAFAEHVPHRDLLVSPGHAIHTGGVLIPAYRLVNGVTITHDTNLHAIEYWHVELDEHDVLLAEGLPAESYLECGNRGFFGNADIVTLGAVPDGRSAAAEPCAPWHETGLVVEEAKRRLIQRAEELGYVLGDAPDLRLEADGVALRPIAVEGAVHRFAVPRHSGPLRLVSASAIPAQTEAGSFDTRHLGVAVSRIERVEGAARRELSIEDDASFAQGWHTLESEDARHWRWTDGRAQIAVDGACVLDITIDMSVRRWLEPEAIAVAA